MDLGGYNLFSGDGMVITDDNDLFVVRPARSLVAKFHLNARYERGRLLSETRPHLPRSHDRSDHEQPVAVVNSQFWDRRRLPRGRYRASGFPDHRRICDGGVDES